jgi:hypothetical protein
MLGFYVFSVVRILVIGFWVVMLSSTTKMEVILFLFRVEVIEDVEVACFPKILLTT